MKASNKAFHHYGAQGAPRVNADVRQLNIMRIYYTAALFMLCIGCTNHNTIVHRDTENASQLTVEQTERLRQVQIDHHLMNITVQDKTVLLSGSMRSMEKWNSAIADVQTVIGTNRGIILGIK